MSIMTSSVPTRECSFCGKQQKDVQHLISGPDVYICDECVILCVEILKDHGTNIMKEIDLFSKEIDGKTYNLCINLAKKKMSWLQIKENDESTGREQTDNQE